MVAKEGGPSMWHIFQHCSADSMNARHQASISKPW